MRSGGKTHHVGVKIARIEKDVSLASKWNMRTFEESLTKLNKRLAAAAGETTA